MRIIFVGDACSGKTAILERLQKAGYEVVLENGWQQIPPEVEADKLKSNLWFINYYFEREQRLSRQTHIMERCLEYQYPFTDAQLSAGKITEREAEELKRLIIRLLGRLQSGNETYIIHLVTSNELIQQRLRARGLVKSAGENLYWDALRHFTAEYFSAKYPYVQFDTSKLPLDAVYQKIVTHISDTLD